MKIVTDRKEIAKYVNVKCIPVITMDLADSDEYGLKGGKCRIDNGTFTDGTPYYIDAELRAYEDEKKFTFCQYGTMLKNDFGYHDFVEMVEYANSPLIKRGEEFGVAITDSRNGGYALVVMTANTAISPFCSTPIGIKDEDNSAVQFFAAAEVNGSKFGIGA